MAANGWYFLAELLLNKLEEYGGSRLGHGAQAVILKSPVLSCSIELSTAQKQSPGKKRDRGKEPKKKRNKKKERQKKRVRQSRRQPSDIPH